MEYLDEKFPSPPLLPETAIGRAKVCTYLENTRKPDVDQFETLSGPSYGTYSGCRYTTPAKS